MTLQEAINVTRALADRRREQSISDARSADEWCARSKCGTALEREMSASYEQRYRERGKRMDRDAEALTVLLDEVSATV